MEHDKILVNDLRILSWNIDGNRVWYKGGVLRNHLERELQKGNPIHMVFLQETKMDLGASFEVPGYHTFNRSRQLGRPCDSRCGGVSRASPAGQPARAQKKEPLCAILVQQKPRKLHPFFLLARHGACQREA